MGSGPYSTETKERECSTLWNPWSGRYQVRAMLVRTSTDANEIETYSLMAFIIPARSHAEVIIAAVAARDKKRAEAHAKRYDIPIVHESYDGKLSFEP